MKFLTAIFLLSLISSGLAQEKYTQMANDLETCYEKIGFTAGGDGPLTVRESKCGLACVLISFKLLNKDGSINVAEALKHNKSLTAEKINEYVQSCEKQGGFNAQSAEYACEIAACFQKNEYFSQTV